jgi:hypothetical protein
MAESWIAGLVVGFAWASIALVIIAPVVVGSRAEKGLRQTGGAKRELPDSRIVDRHHDPLSVRAHSPRTVAVRAADGLLAKQGPCGPVGPHAVVVLKAHEKGPVGYSPQDSRQKGVKVRS